MATPAPLRAMEFWLTAYRRTWRGTVATSFVNPVLFLTAMGLGLGSIVDDRASAVADLGGVDYVAFLGPALLAATAMQVASVEATWPVFSALKWTRAYPSMQSTPLRVEDLLAGHVAFIAFRIGLSVLAFFVVMALFGAVQDPAAPIAILAGLLTGLAFATPVAAWTATRESYNGFNYLFRFLVIPMFLFSGTFFPLEELPAWIRPVAWVTPLWHGVELSRGAALGDIDWALAPLHVTYLAALALGGYLVARRTFAERLVV